MKAFVSSKCPAFWDQFALANSSMVFHRSIWADILRNGYGGNPLFCWMERQGKPVIGTMGMIMDFKVARILYAAVPYGGIIGDDAAVPDFCRLLEPKLRSIGVHKIHIFEPRCTPFWVESGFSVTEMSRHQVNLSGHDITSFERSLPRSVRKAIRKSEKEHVVIKEVSERSEIQDVYKLYLKTMAHNNAAAKYPIGRFLSIFDSLVPRGLAVILVASCGDKLVGSNTLVCSDDTIHDIQLSYDHDYQHVRPNDALVFDSIKWALKKGGIWFDFMGSPTGDESLERFKAKWGAEKTIACNYNKTLSQLRGACWIALQKIAEHSVGACLVRAIRRFSAHRS